MALLLLDVLRSLYMNADQFSYNLLSKKNRFNERFLVKPINVRIIVIYLEGLLFQILGTLVLAIVPTSFISNFRGYLRKNSSLL